MTSRATSWLAPTLALVWVAIVLAAPLAVATELAWPISLTPVERDALARASVRGVTLALAVASVATALAPILARTIPPIILLGCLLLGRFVVAHGVLAVGLAPGSLAASLALIADLAPFAAMIVLLRLRTRPTALLEAAADLGAGTWTRSIRVDGPHMRPALLAAFIWSLLQALGDVVAFELAGGGHAYTLGLLIRDALVHEAAPDRALVGVASLVVLALVSAIVIARELGHAEHHAIHPSPPAPAWLRMLGWVLLTAISIGPVTLLIGEQPDGFGPSDHHLLRTLGRTLASAAGIAAVAAVIGFAAAIATRSRGTGSTVVAVALLLPLAIPPSVLGLLMLALATRLGWPPGLGLTVVALLGPAVALAFVTARVLIRAIPTTWIEAAADLGATRLDRLRLVWLPLGRPAMLVAAVVVFAWVLGQAAIPAFTSGPGGDTLAVALTIHARAGAMALVRRWSLVVVIVAVVGVVAVAWATRTRRA